MSEDIERKSLLEQHGLYKQEQYNRWYRATFRREPPVQIPKHDREWVSPLGGLAAPDPRYQKGGKR